MDTDQDNLSLLHFARLSSFGGVQWQFASFAEYSDCVFNVTHDVVACSKDVHPLLRPVLGDRCRSLLYDNRILGLRISKKLVGLRKAYLRRVVRRAEPDAILLWDRVEQFSSLPGHVAERCIYWEHGSSWTQRRYVDERRHMLGNVSCAIANSFAAKRILQLKWNYTGDVAVCLNAVRPNVQPQEPVAKRLPVDREVRIGVAAKLVPFKAVQLALHVFKSLRSQGLEARLDVAGDGPERMALGAL